MMTSRIVMSFCYVLLLFAAGCETVVEVEAPPHVPQLVAHGFFTSDGLWLVRVTHSVAYTSRDDPGSVEAAIVTVLAPDGRMQTLARRDSGLFVGTDLRPMAQAAYTLRVEAPGFVTTQGSDQLPEKPNVAGFTAASTMDRGRRRLVDLSFSIDDPPDTANYYGVFVVQGRWRLDVKKGTITPLTPTLFTFESDDPIFENNPEIEFLGDEVRYYRDPFFDDTEFNGTLRDVTLRLRYQDPDPQADVQIWRAFALMVVSASDNLYEYWTTANRQLTTGQNPFAEPIRVHSNMSNGFGVFGGFQYRALPVPPDQTGLIAFCDTTTRWKAVCDSVGAPAGPQASLPVRERFLDGPITH
jgi:hypothetical protein